MVRRIALFLLLPFALVACKKDAPQPAPAEAPPAAEAAPAAEGAAAKEEAVAPAAEAEEAPAPPSDGIPDPVALVNGVGVPAEAFRQALSRYSKPDLKIPEDRLKRLKSTLLDRLIDDALVEARVGEAKIEIGAPAIDEEFNRYKSRFRSEDQYTKYLAHSGMNEDRIRKQIRQRLQLEALLDKEGSLSVTDKEAREFYDKHENLYKERETVHAAHVLVRLPEAADDETKKKAKDKLTKVQAALKEGKDFAEVARDYSDGPSGPRGGDLGFFGRGQMVKEFEEVAFSLKPGTVSQPVRTPFGWHIIKVIDKKKGRTRPFTEVKEQLLESLRRKKFAQEKRKLLQELHKSGKIEKKVQF